MQKYRFFEKKKETNRLSRLDSSPLLYHLCTGYLEQCIDFLCQVGF